MNNEWLKNFLEWLERVLPGFLLSFGIGYNTGRNGKDKIEAELEKEKVNGELKQNEIDNEKHFGHMADDDVIDEILSGVAESSGSIPKDDRNKGSK